MSEQGTTTSKAVANAAFPRPASVGAAEASPSPADTASSRAVIVEEDEPTGDSDSLRRRRRRRRRRSLKTDNPERRVRMILLGLVVFLLIIAVTGAQVGSWLRDVFIQAKPAVAAANPLIAMVKRLFRWEVLALVVAGLVLLYLQPGVEDKVLRTLGIKKDRRRR